MHSITRDGFVDESGRIVPFLRLAPGGETEEWQRKQQNSESQYHEQLTDLPERLQLIYRLFDHYIAAALWRAPGSRVLDVGCGISPAFPPYAGTLERLHAAGRVVYAGLDPIEANVEARSYPFIHGRLEDLPGKLRDRFDAFVFSTSLDHFEDVGRAGAEVRKVASPGAIAIFWVGLHDPQYVAELMGSDLFGRYLHDAGSTRLLRGALQLLARIPVMAGRLAARQRRLDRHEPLDELHFHYFTGATLADALARFGTVLDVTRLPGSNSVFATVAVSAAGP
jgi:SAM-dependent methyltransferase